MRSLPSDILQRLHRHPWTTAAANLLLVMALYTLCRLFFVWVNRDLYPDLSSAHLMEMLAGGLRFDLTAVLYLNSVYLVLMLLPLPTAWRNRPAYQKTALWFYWIPNILGLLANAADTVYVRFSDRRTTMAFFTEFENDDNLTGIFLTGMVQYWYVTLFALLIVAVLIVLTRRRFEVAPHRSLVYYPVETALLCCSAYFIVMGIRGGFGAYTRPITLSNALQYTNTPQETMIVLNTPFSLMRSSDSKTYRNPNYFGPEALDSIMTPLHEPYGQPETMQQLNVAVLILESFSKEYIGFYNRRLDDGTYAGYTPFLDSLLQHSVTYTRSFASGRKSIDAMPSVLSSIPMLIEPYIVTPYSTNAVSSLADCLTPKGYTTAFFHGAPNGSMGFQAYARSAGFQHYYGMDEYDGPDAFDGTWAVWDEEFLQFYARTMSVMAEPFMTAVFTASSHHPFRVPKRYENAFPEGPHPIHRCIGYSDNALRKFFDYAKQQPWFGRTLFVLTADHTNQLTHPEYLNAKGIFEVPIAFYLLGREEGKMDSLQVVSQTDIMPSVLSYLHYDSPFFAFGEDVLTAPKEHNYAICYNHPAYQLFTDSLLIQFDGKTPSAVYRYTDDPLLQHPINEVPQQPLTYLKAYIQQYIERMTGNRLTCPKNE